MNNQNSSGQPRNPKGDFYRPPPTHSTQSARRPSTGLYAPATSTALVALPRNPPTPATTSIPCHSSPQSPGTGPLNSSFAESSLRSQLNVRNQEIEDANDVLSKTSTLLEDSKSLIARLQVELEQEKNKVEEEQKKYRTSYAKYYAEVKKLNSISAEKDFEITQLNKNITRFKGAWNEAEEKVKRREKYADIIRKERYTYKTNNDVLQSQNSRLAGQVDDLRNQVNENAQQSQNLQELQSKHSIDLEQLREEYEHELAQEVDKTESLHAKFMEETGFLRLKLTAVEGEAQMLRSREALAQGQMKTEKNGLASAKKRKPSEAVTIDGTSPEKKSKEGEHVSDGKVSVKGYWIMMDGVPKWVEPYERKKPEWKKKGTNDPEENAEKEVSQELGKNP